MMDQELTDEQLLRYSRQIMLPNLDIAGQHKILNAKVVVIGAGGLGNPAAMYLAAAGIGHLYLVDNDFVDLTNLQRQVGFIEEQKDVPKVSALAKRLKANNSDISITEVNERLDEGALSQLIQSSDLVLDCTDNLKSRLMINRVCWSSKVPLVSAAAIGFEGQLSVYDANDEASPCYQCLYGEVDEQALTCSEAGVLGPVVGSMGVLQALEALKLITGVGETLTGRLQIFDALAHQWRTIRLKKDPACSVCKHS